MKTTLILAVITALAIFGAVKLQKEPGRIAESGSLLFPGLIDRLNDTAEVGVESGGAKVSLRAKDGGWVVTEKGDYPAEEEELRELLIGLAQLERVEPKTSKVEHYKTLELEDPSVEGGQSIRYSLRTAAGDTLADIIVGKRRLEAVSTDTDQYFVRLPDDPRAWLVSGNIPKNADVTDWLAEEVIKVDEKRVHSVVVTHPDGERVEVVRRAPEGGDFALLGMPAGAKLESEYALQSFGTTPADIKLNDVLAQSEVDFEAAGGLEVVMETFDGLRVRIETARHDEAEYIRLRAELDPTLPGLTGAAGVLEDADKAKPLKDAAAVEAEVAALNAKWSPWAFRIPGYQVDTLRKKVADLVEVPAAESEPRPKDS